MIPTMVKKTTEKPARVLTLLIVPSTILIFGTALAPLAHSRTRIHVGSKKFTESYILGEIITQKLRSAGVNAIHHPGMGGTIVLWQALRSGAIDIYPEYTGTLREQILKTPTTVSLQAIRKHLAREGITMSNPLGFNNTYALVMRRDIARRLGIRTISDLRRFPNLRAGLTHEFLRRHDGWEPLKRAYQLPIHNVRGIEHALGYQALMAGQIDLKDAYATDAKLRLFPLQLLEDDRNFFPEYQAVILYRKDLNPKIVAVIRSLEGQIDEQTMISLNALAEKTRDYAAAAAHFLNRAYHTPSTLHNILHWTLRHLYLVSTSMMLAILIGIPLGIRAARGDFIARAILGTTGMIYTIPSLALLALLVPLPFFGIRVTTAIAALFLYSLLPIVRNTATGLQSIPPDIRESAEALGLDPWTRRFKIELPIASRSILAGIKTSTIINIGTATLAALIGAGGLGEPIISGLNLNDHRTILEGAIPTALLALTAELFFTLIDRLIIPRGLRISQNKP